MNVGNKDELLPGGIAWRNMAVKKSEDLKDECHKKIILDIYCKTVPLDQKYIAGNLGTMKSDVDEFLGSKNMTATQYITSAYEKTKAPLLEFIIRSGNTIAKEYMAEATKILKDAKENDTPLSPPTIDDNNIDDALIDVKNDTEYETFIDELKQKTIDKIVTDISDIIDDTKEKDDMVFEPDPTDAVTESTISVVMNYFNKNLIKENYKITNEMQDQMIGFAIRESTLNIIDSIFKQPNSDFKSFAGRIRFGKGFLINESAIQNIKDSIDTFTEKKKPIERLPISDEEQSAVNKRFGNDTECSFAKDKDGIYCYTHRCRSKSYESVDKIPKDKVKFVSSTS